MEGGKQLALLLIVAGALVAGAGLILLFYDRIPFLGRLPGDIAFRRGNVRVFIPITTTIIISLVFTLVLWLVEILKRK